MNQEMVGGEDGVQKYMHRDIENTGIKGGKSEQGWSMVTRKGSRSLALGNTTSFKTDPPASSVSRCPVDDDQLS